jgi:uncharacterized membrane protein
VRIVVTAVTISADCELSRQILQSALGETAVLQPAQVTAVTTILTSRNHVMTSADCRNHT